MTEVIYRGTEASCRCYDCTVQYTEAVYFM